MKDELIELMYEFILKDRLQNDYKRRIKNFDFILKINRNKLRLPFNVVVDFNKIYFSSYKEVLIKYAVMYASLVKDKDYLNFINNEFDNLQFNLDNNILFQAKTTQYAFLLLGKSDKKIYNYNIKYSNLLNKISKIFIEVNSLTVLYRKLMLNFLSSTDQADRENLLDDFLLNDDFDEDFISLSNGIINKDNIRKYKSILIRLILADSFLFIERMNKEDEELEIDEADKIVDNIDKKILSHINNCVHNEQYTLPNDDEIRLFIYTKFISYNLYTSDIENDLKVIESDDKSIKKLSKINPLYNLDRLNSEQ
ncbi:MAG: hypothetical protein IJD92_03880 [Bacilli bacterium]|nr:hypothetical protein [Bacilli bacterium]